MIISIDAEKAFDKIQHPYDKNSPESRNRRNIPQHNKSYIWQTHSKHYLPAILIPACASSSPALHTTYSAFKLNKQGYNI